MIVFRFVESLQRHDLRHDRAGKRFCLVKLGNVRLGNMLLLVVGVENRRPILRAGVWSLAITLCRIMGQFRLENFEKLPVRNLRRVEGDLHGFGVAGLSCAHLLVFGIRERSSGISRGGVFHTFDVLENATSEYPGGSLANPIRAGEHRRDRLGPGEDHLRPGADFLQFLKVFFSVAHDPCTAQSPGRDTGTQRMYGRRFSSQRRAEAYCRVLHASARRWRRKSPTDIACRCLVPGDCAV